MKYNFKIRLLFLLIFFLQKNINSQTVNDCLYKNPLCFYNTDILKYLQVLHKNQQYDRMKLFLCGPILNMKDKVSVEQKLSNVSFGYLLKRVGIKEINKTRWSLTYQRTILGTFENFKIECALINDTCKMFIDNKTWSLIFK